MTKKKSISKAQRRNQVAFVMAGIRNNLTNLTENFKDTLTEDELERMIKARNLAGETVKLLKG